MKKLFFIAIAAMPLLIFGQGKTIINSQLITPKPGKLAAFENAVKAHVAKFHTGEKKAHILEILSGPNSGSFLWVDGPMSFEDMDNVKTDPAHDLDWQTNLDPLIESYGDNNYSRRREDLSYGAQDITIEKSQAVTFNIRRGKMDDALALRKKIKELYEKTGDKRNITVYTKLFAGTSQQMVIILRYPTGWKEMEEGFYPSMMDLVKKTYGEDAAATYDRANNEIIESVEVAIRKYRKDLSSK